MRNRLVAIAVCSATLFAIFFAPRPVRAEKASHSAVEPVFYEGAGCYGVHHASKLWLAENKADMMLFGDSIVRRLGQARGGLDVWERHFGQYKVLNAGIAKERTQTLLWRLRDMDFREQKPRLAILMVGTHNVYDNTAPQIAEGVLLNVAELRKRVPSATVLVLGFLPYGKAPDGPQRTGLEETNQIVETKIREMNDPKVEFLNLGTEFLEQDGTIREGLLMSDYRQPSKTGYEVLINAMAPTVNRIMGE